MNKARREELIEAAALLDQLSEEVGLWCASADLLKENLQSLHDEEKQAYENTPTTLKETDRALNSIEAIDGLRSAVGNMERAVHYIDAALQDITNISEE